MKTRTRTRTGIWAAIPAALLALTLSPSHTAGAPAPSSAMKIDFGAGAGSVEFLAVGRPSALKIVGKGAAPQGQLLWKDGSVTGSLSLELGSLDTGIELRNRHMKEKYLETAKFPQAKLTLTRLALPDALAAGDFTQEALPFEATLSLHGVEKPVKGTARVERKGGGASVTASFSTRISDFNLGVPSFAGITVADEVSVNVTASPTLVPQNAAEKK